MFDTTLTVRKEDYVDQIVIGADGMVIGRHDDCDIVLDDAGVSRHHARLYRDPFGRWIIEDLESHNGVWLDGRRVSAQTVGPGEAVVIGPFTLTIEDEQTLQMPAEAKTSAHATLVDDALGGAELLSKAQRDETLSSDRLKQLNELAEHLINLSGPEELYPSVCRQIAGRPEEVALILRVPGPGQPLPASPEALAFCSGGHTPETLPHNLSLHVSRRVLEAARSSSSAVMAGAAKDDGQQMELTIVDDRKPRAVLSARIGGTGNAIDVLYLDIPADRASEALLDYIQAVARQANYARKSILLAEARAERAILDRQLEFAREIQTQLTPALHIETADAEVAIHYEPAMWVGGDYCDVWTLKDGRLAWAIGDVSGKGLPAALVMATMHGAVRTALTFCDDLAEAITGLSNHLVGHTPDDMFVTLLAGVFDPASGGLEFVNAGHVLPLLLTGDGQTAPLGEPMNPPIGILEHQYIAEQHTLPMGATLLSVTDGITESTSPAGDMLGEDGLSELVAGQGPVPTEALVQSVAAAAEDFRKPLGPQDDTTVLAITRGPAK